jgi:hypothetical protein
VTDAPRLVVAGQQIYTTLIAQSCIAVQAQAFLLPILLKDVSPILLKHILTLPIKDLSPKLRNDVSSLMLKDVTPFKHKGLSPILPKDA